MAEQALAVDTTPTDTGAPAADTGRDSAPTEPKSQREQRREAKQRGTSMDRAVTDAGKKVSSGSVDPLADPNAPPPKAWEAPKYATAWKEQRRKALEAFATRDDLKDHWKELDGQLNEFHEWDSKRNWEIGNYRKNFDPVADTLGQMSQQYQLQGMSLQQGLGQLWGISQRLAQDPDSTLAWLGSQFKPRNPQQAAMALAQAWGINLGELAQGQPYVDPHVAKELSQTRAQLQQTQQAIWQQQQAAKQQQMSALVNHITEFETAKDASGKPKFPFATEVGPEMGTLLQMGKAQSLEQAYEMATKYHPPAQEARQKAAELAARDAAARNTTDAEQARAAGRNINGKPNGREQRSVTMMDAILRAEKSTFGKSR